MVNIRIPPHLRKFTNQQGEVQVKGNTVIEVIEGLERDYPGIKKRILDEEGEIKEFITIFVGEDDIRFLKGKETPVEEREITIIPTIAGG